MLAWCYLLIVAVLIFYSAVGVNCGRMRVRHKIQAPAMTGHPEFERASRVQMNTLEHLVPFLPAFVLSAHLTSATGALILGIAWLIGRIWYAQSYMTAPEKRGPGFMIAFVSLVLLLLGAGYGAIRMIAIGQA